MRVALFTRAWIEIITAQKDGVAIVVALFTRAWIEIPSVHKPRRAYTVALFTRAWIEMHIAAIVSTAPPCRPLHEGVD